MPAIFTGLYHHDHDDLSQGRGAAVQRCTGSAEGHEDPAEAGWGQLPQVGVVIFVTDI